jgi:hypothetical protein
MSSGSMMSESKHNLASSTSRKLGISHSNASYSVQPYSPNTDDKRAPGGERSKPTMEPVAEDRLDSRLSNKEKSKMELSIVQQSVREESMLKS